MSRLRKSAMLAAGAAAFVGAAEGVRTNAYPDPATKGPPWTTCYGETEGVRRGDRRTIEECKAGLLKGLERYATKVEACLPGVELPDQRYIAVLSLAWNIGPAGFCRSSIARLLREGRPREACNAFMKYNRAAGVVFPGLTRRRERERALCLEGL